MDKRIPPTSRIVLEYLMAPPNLIIDTVESRVMLKERACAIKKTAIETQNDALPRVFAVGRSYDEIRPIGDGFQIRRDAASTPVI